MALRSSAIAIIAFAMFVAGCGGSATEGVLTGSVGPGYAIALKNHAGQSVTTLKPGRYSITIDDESAFLNFHLFGPGVSEMTSITGKGISQWSVRLQRGLYQYQCDAHASFVHGSFRVT